MAKIELEPIDISIIDHFEDGTTGRRFWTVQAQRFGGLAVHPKVLTSPSGDVSFSALNYQVTHIRTGTRLATDFPDAKSARAFARKAQWLNIDSARTLKEMGLPYDKEARATLDELEALAMKYGGWLHRSDKINAQPDAQPSQSEAQS